MKYEKRIKHLLDQMLSGRTKLRTNGKQVADGYKPDRTYRRNNQVWVVEIEASTSRKGYIGGYLKAQKYFQDEHRKGRGRLLFIIQCKDTNLEAIWRQLAQYHEWLQKNGISVQPTYLIYDTSLNYLMRDKVELFSRDFLAATMAIR